MKALQLLKKKDNLPLLCILFIAIVLRFYRLGFESFWLDELHTMNETDPAISFSQLFHYLKFNDLHPPLFFLCERFIFSLFGRGETIARFLPALAGVVSVWAMYLLGKELLNKNLGLIASAFTCVNYFNIYYSREARGYIFAFLMAVLSLLFLIRLIKYLRVKDMWYLSLFALLTMYSHYYGIFLVCSEFCVALILLFFEENRKLYMRRFILSGLIIAVGYSPWVPFLINLSQIKNFWIGQIGQDFIFTFFNAYFGNSDFLKPILLVLLLFYLVNVFGKNEVKLTKVKDNSLTFSFVLFSICMVVTYTIPYIQSLLTVPMIYDRYTIVVLPIFLAAAAYGVALISDKLARGVVFWIFITWSLLLIVLTDKTYTSVHKTQFRELTAYMAADPQAKQYPIINDRIFWHEAYYLNQFHYSGPILSEPRAAVIDSLIRGTSPEYQVDGFWIMNAHVAGDPASYLDPKTKSSLDSFFVMEEEKRLFDCWAQLYVSRHGRKRMTVTFPANNMADIGEKVVAIWVGSVSSNPLTLKQGDYALQILAKGTPCRDTMARLVVSINDKVIGDYYTDKDYQNKEFTFKEPRDSDSVRVKLELVNDQMDPKTGEDRNAFVKKIVFLKQ
jgi:mannosyltransferase